MGKFFGSLVAGRSKSRLTERSAPFQICSNSTSVDPPQTIPTSSTRSPGRGFSSSGSSSKMSSWAAAASATREASVGALGTASFRVISGGSAATASCESAAGDATPGCVVSSAESTRAAVCAVSLPALRFFAMVPRPYRLSADFCSSGLKLSRSRISDWKRVLLRFMR